MKNESVTLSILTKSFFFFFLLDLLDLPLNSAYLVIKVFVDIVLLCAVIFQGTLKR